jgi:hypothetical protein
MTDQHEQRREGVATDPKDERTPVPEATTRRGADERRGTVNPAHNPAPRSPEPDREAIEKGQETLERVKPY